MEHRGHYVPTTLSSNSIAAVKQSPTFSVCACLRMHLKARCHDFSGLSSVSCPIEHAFPPTSRRRTAHLWGSRLPLFSNSFLFPPCFLLLPFQLFLLSTLFSTPLITYWLTSRCPTFLPFFLSLDTILPHIDPAQSPHHSGQPLRALCLYVTLGCAPWELLRVPTFTSLPSFFLLTNGQPNKQAGRPK